MKFHRLIGVLWIGIADHISDEFVETQFNAVQVGVRKIELLAERLQPLGCFFDQSRVKRPRQQALLCRQLGITRKKRAAKSRLI